MFASTLLALPKSVIKLPKTILQYAIRAAKVLPPGLIYLSSSFILSYCAIVLCVIFLSLFGHTQPVFFIARCNLTLAFSSVHSGKLECGLSLNNPALRNVSQLCMSVFQAAIKSHMGGFACEGIVLHCNVLYCRMREKQGYFSRETWFCVG